MLLLGLIQIRAFAEQTGRWGLGVVAGEPMGVTGTYWFDVKAAIDFGYGFNNDGILFGDYLWHGWPLRALEETGKMTFYLGLGARYENEKHGDDKYAARVPLGVNYLFDKSPFEVFAELVPVVQFKPDGDLNFDAGIGVRFYFDRFR